MCVDACRLSHHILKPLKVAKHSSNILSVPVAIRIYWVNESLFASVVLRDGQVKV